MAVKGGVVIIGSLLWDNAKRQEWRKNHLDYQSGVQVYLPIRYGRKSKGEKRKGTHTMVISNKCYTKSYGLGNGWILPLKKRISSFDDLKIEAQAMGEAEGINDGFSSSWGIVALLRNPNKKNKNVFKAEWIELMSKRASTFLLSMDKLRSERYPIDSNGFMTIKWPKVVGNEKSVSGFDFLLVAVTLPTLVDRKRYPPIGQIAKAMKQGDYYEYFIKNQQNRITTFQDARILKKINVKL